MTVVTKLLFSEVNFDKRLVQALEELFSKTCAAAAAAKKERSTESSIFFFYESWKNVACPRLDSRQTWLPVQSMNMI
jgi:hypothetical protein